MTQNKTLIIQKGIHMEVSKLEEDIAEAIVGLLLVKQKHSRSNKTSRVEKTLKELSFLEDVFKVSSYPDYETKQTISLLLGMAHKVIQIWFQNKRRCLKSEIRRQVLSDKNCLRNHKLSKERLYKKICVDSKLFMQQSIPFSVILKIYCKTFDISWDFP